MGKISLEPRKTTWVRFIDEKAKLKVERKCLIHYYRGDVLSNMTRCVDMTYNVTGLKSGKCIPSSQLIIKEGGIPVAITQTVVSLSPDKFSSASTHDPFVEIEDNVASVDKSKVKQRTLSKRLIERTWTETVTRGVKIENKTGRNMVLQIRIFENPADDIVFISSNPKPLTTAPPMREWEIKLKKEQERTIKIKFSVKRKENIRLPPDKTGKAKSDQHDQNEMQQAAMPVDEEYFEENEEQIYDAKG